MTSSNPASLSGYEGAASVPSGTFISVLKDVVWGVTEETRTAERGVRFLPGYN